MEINEQEIGQEFLNSIIKVLKIRSEKRKEYKDTYLSDTPEFLLSQIENKVKRIKLRLENKNTPELTEKLQDNILDAIIYLHFLNIVIFDIKNEKQ